MSTFTLDSRFGTFHLQSRRRRRSLMESLAVCAGALALPATSLAQAPDFSAPHHPERLLVRFKAGVSDEKKAQVHAGVGAEKLKGYGHVDGLVLVRVPAAELQTARGRYAGDPNVLYAEPDYEISFGGVCDGCDPTDPGYSATGCNPDDPSFCDGNL